MALLTLSTLPAISLALDQIHLQLKVKSSSWSTDWRPFPTLMEVSDIPSVLMTQLHCTFLMGRGGSNPPVRQSYPTKRYMSERRPIMTFFENKFFCQTNYTCYQLKTPQTNKTTSIVFDKVLFIRFYKTLYWKTEMTRLCILSSVKFLITYLEAANTKLLFRWVH